MIVAQKRHNTKKVPVRRKPELGLLSQRKKYGFNNIIRKTLSVNRKMPFFVLMTGRLFGLNQMGI